MESTIKIIIRLTMMMFFISEFIAAQQEIPAVVSYLLSDSFPQNKLEIPRVEKENDNELLVQCEEKISYFVVAYGYWSQKPTVMADNGRVVIDDEGEILYDDTYSSTYYLKGHIEGESPLILVSQADKPHERAGWKMTKKCRTHEDTTNKLEIPTFNGNSQGKLEVQCEQNIAYFIMAYDCLRSDTTPYVTVDNGIVVIDEQQHIGEVFYVKGHIDKSGSVTISGHVYTGGAVVPYTWVQSCP